MNLEAFKNLIILYCMDAPEWGEYAAVDDNGWLWIFENKPILKFTDGYWQNTQSHGVNSERVVKVRHMSLNEIKWEDTLIEL